MTQQTPWAVLRCKWNDQSVEPESKSFFERLFTPAGSGTRNMVEYFDLMSHGNIDVSGSQVFGWFTLPRPQSDYAGNVAVPPDGQINRQGLIELARSTATASGVDLTRFWGVMVCMNVNTDLFGSPAQYALCSPGSFEPAVLGQEMGHGFGLDHSRLAGSTADYQDPWDTMSTWNGCHMAADSDYTLIGPGLNAANMRGRGWLDSSRLWTSSTPDYTEIIELRPLHRRDLPGFLAAEVGSHLVEFRVKDAWDAAIPRAAVLVHTFVDNHSYIQPGTNGNLDLVAGDTFESGNASVTTRPYTSVKVVGIDARGRTATLEVTHRKRDLPPLKVGGSHGIPWVDGGGFLGAHLEGGGGLIVVGGRTISLEAGDPAIGVLESLAAFQAVGSVRETAARDSVRRAAMHDVAEFASSRLDELDRFETPPEQVKKAAPRSRPASRKKRS